MYTVRIFGDPVLRVKAKPITVFDEALKKIAIEMTETMYVEDGVGLAAPQVGLSISMTVIDTTGGEEAPLVIINPQIIESSEELVEHEEGCLSFPDMTLKITRPAIVTVKAQDISGKEFVIAGAEGLLSRALQHEIDHLNAMMIIDRVSLLQRKMITSKLKKLTKEQGAKPAGTKKTKEKLQAA